MAVIINGHYKYCVNPTCNECEPMTFKKLIKVIKLPSTGKIYGDSYRWHKRGGHAGRKSIEKTVTAAKKNGFEKREHKNGSSPDGSIVGSGSVYYDEDGNCLRTSCSFGATADGNSYSITLDAAPSF